LEEVGRIIEAANHDRVRACLDTQHAFASGYDLRTQAGVDFLLREVDHRFGFGKLALMHANDSRRELGSNVDRHANIGEGEIGLDAFTRLMREPRLRVVPWMLEVPGSENSGPDVVNINRLRECAGREPLPVPS